MEFPAEKQRREASAGQATKLAENNAALARTNSRLLVQLEQLRAEHEKLMHLSAGQLAIARAKEAEQLVEFAGLKRLLRESMIERQGLRAQLLAKQARCAARIAVFACYAPRVRARGQPPCTRRRPVSCT